MARLDPATRQKWKSALSGAGGGWVACGLDTSGSPAAQLEGVAGLIDWIVHGQVSRLLLRGQLARGECCVIAGDPARSRPSFLLFPEGGRSGSAAALAERAKSLGIKEITLAENTFSEDFLAKVKQTFKKEGIHCGKLELDVAEPE